MVGEIISESWATSIGIRTMMTGMAPTMSLLMMGRDMRAMDPFELIFWAVMSLGVMVRRPSLQRLDGEKADQTWLNDRS